MKNKFASLVVSNVFFAGVIGFVLGSVLPVYGLFQEEKAEWGNLGEWVSAIGTIMAVAVSLYLANQGRNPQIDISGYILAGSEHMSLLNKSEVPVRILPAIWVKEEFLADTLKKHPEFSKQLGEYKNKQYKLPDEKDEDSSNNFVILRPFDSYECKVDERIITELKRTFANQFSTDIGIMDLATGYLDEAGVRHRSV